MRETSSVVEQIPDRIEPVIGYRNWWTLENGLYSIGWSTTHWQPLKMISAIHIFNIDNIIPYNDICKQHTIDNCRGSKSEVFDDVYKCGVHATKQELEVNMRFIAGTRIVYGQVYLWGLIVEHELGYRAEYAYPKCLYLNGKKDDKIRMIANNYKIPAIKPPAIELPVMEPQPHFNSLVDLQRDTYNAISRDTGVQG